MISKESIKKWYRMIAGKSSLHTPQMEGKFYSKSEISGYYNDLRGKVYFSKNIDKFGIPFNYASDGINSWKFYFPIAIFQYGLGLFDLYIEKKDRGYLDRAIKIGEWAVRNQNENGSWNTFGFLKYACPFSAMAQGEAVSLLSRLFLCANLDKFYDAALLGTDFMLKDVKDGGTCKYTDKGIVLLEYPDRLPVLNGWIFSSFGLWDMYLLTKDFKYLNSFNQTINAMSCSMDMFDAGFWSYYSLDGKICSPFYHALHVELLKTLYNICGNEVFLKFKNRWDCFNNSNIYPKIAFIYKAYQKIMDKKTEELFISR